MSRSRASTTVLEPHVAFFSCPFEIMEEIFSYLPFHTLQNLANTNTWFRAYASCNFFKTHPKRSEDAKIAHRRRIILNQLHDAARSEPQFIGRNLQPCSYCGVLKPMSCFTTKNRHSARLFTCYCIDCGLDPKNGLLSPGSRIDRPETPGVYCALCCRVVYGYEAGLKSRCCRICRMTNIVEGWMVRLSRCMEEMRDIQEELRGNDDDPPDASFAAWNLIAKPPFLRAFCERHEKCRTNRQKAEAEIADKINGRSIAESLAVEGSETEAAAEDDQAERDLAKRDEIDADQPGETLAASVPLAEVSSMNIVTKKLLSSVRNAMEIRIAADVARTDAKREVYNAHKECLRAEAAKRTSNPCYVKDLLWRAMGKVNFEELYAAQIDSSLLNPPRKISTSAGRVSGNNDSGHRDLGYPILTHGSKWWLYLRFEIAKHALGQTRNRTGAYTREWSKCRQKDTWRSEDMSLVCVCEGGPRPIGPSSPCVLTRLRDEQCDREMKRQSRELHLEGKVKRKVEALIWESEHSKEYVTFFLNGYGWADFHNSEQKMAIHRANGDFKELCVCQSTLRQRCRCLH